MDEYEHAVPDGGPDDVIRSLGRLIGRAWPQLLRVMPFNIDHLTINVPSLAAAQIVMPW